MIGYDDFILETDFVIFKEDYVPYLFPTDKPIGRDMLFIKGTRFRSCLIDVQEPMENGLWRIYRVEPSIIDFIFRNKNRVLSGDKLKLFYALNCEFWKSHKISDEYQMDGKSDIWKIVYYPLFENGKTGESYEEPRALVETPIPNGTDFREVPLRYLTKTK